MLAEKTVNVNIISLCCCCESLFSHFPLRSSCLSSLRFFCRVQFALDRTTKCAEGSARHQPSTMQAAVSRENCFKWGDLKNICKLGHNGNCSVQSELDVEHDIQKLQFHVSKHSAVTGLNYKCPHSKKVNTLVGFSRWGSHCLFLNTNFMCIRRACPAPICTD